MENPCASLVGSNVSTALALELDEIAHHGLLVRVHGVLVVGKAGRGLVGVAMDGVEAFGRLTDGAINLGGVPHLAETDLEHQHASGAIAALTAIVFRGAPLGSEIDAGAQPSKVGTADAELGDGVGQQHTTRACRDTGPASLPRRVRAWCCVR